MYKNINNKYKNYLTISTIFIKNYKVYYNEIAIYLFVFDLLDLSVFNILP